MDGGLSELANASLTRLFTDSAQREAARQGLLLKLGMDRRLQSRPCESIADRDLRLTVIYAGIYLRLLYETDPLRVWSISLAEPVRE